MGRRRTGFLKTVQAALRRRYVSCFIDPAETRLLQILGGSMITIGSLKKDGKPFTIILSQGRLLKSEHFRRVAYDNKSVLFMNDINQIIAIRGSDYERDVLHYQDQEEDLMARGYRVKYIPQSWLERNPILAANSIKQFIYS